MDRHVVKQLVQKQFGRTAEKYVVSEGHAQGDDLSLLVQWLQPQPTWNVLDIATGGGHVTKRLAPLVSHVVASDLTADMLHAARSHLSDAGINNVSYVIADAEQLPFPDGAFDLVTCRIAAHHFPNPGAFVSESSRVLRPGGKFLLVDNISPENEPFAEYLNTFERMRDESHVRCLSVSEWTGWFSRNGLRIGNSQLFRKRIAFQPWVRRMATSDTQASSVERFILDGPASVREYFDVQVQDEHVQSMTIDSWMVMCVKTDC